MVDIFDEHIIGQKRTSRSKPFVFLTDEFAIKGPYTKNSKRLENVLSRSDIFEAWNTPCVVNVYDNLQEGNDVYVRFPNIMKGYELQWEEHIDPFNNKQYRLLNDSPVTDIRTSLDTNKWIYNEVENLLVGLCHCNILGIGDMNLRNCMVDQVKKVFYIIDYDDDLGTDRDDEYFYFNKAPAAKLKWYENVKHLYPKVSTRLRNLLNNKIVIEKNLISRVNRAIALLDKYSNVDRPVENIEKDSSTNKPVMEWHGLMAPTTITASGLSFDIAKSALQKYVRRNIPGKAILAAIEIYRFAEVGGNAGVTNLFNRLAIIAGEDVGTANLPLVLEVIRTVSTGDRDLYRMIAMVHAMCDSLKTRLMNHMWYAYGNPFGREEAKKRGIKIDEELRSDDIEFIANPLDIFLEGDPEALKPLVQIFYKRLLEKDFNACVWASEFLQKSKDLKVKSRKKFSRIRGNTTSPDILLWKVLEKMLDIDIYEILANAYYTQSESRIFLELAILTTLIGINYEKYDLEPIMNIWKQQQQLLNDMLTGVYKLEVDDYVIDKHTRKGKSMGKNIKDFVTEGALVIPQDPNQDVKILREIYENRT